jgi:hypothetical protein
MKLTKDVEECSVEFADNGFVVRANGRNADDDWTSMKIICPTLDGVFNCIKQLSDLPKE